MDFFLGLLYVKLIINVSRFKRILELSEDTFSKSSARTPWAGDQLVTRSLPIHRATKIRNKHTRKSMPRVEFEPKTSEFDQP